MNRQTGSLTLTTLPDIAVDDILTRLPIKDAVRTTVLSHAWRRRWQSIPALDLWGLPPNIISQLLLHHSSPVKSCRFGPLLKMNKKEEPCPVYCWLSALSRRSASTLLSLTLSFEGSLSINSLACYFPNLTNLRLGCHPSISPDCFSGIPNLRTLHLEDVCTNLSVLVSQFPLLEELNIDNFIYEEGTSSIVEVLAGAPRIRRLEVNYRMLGAWSRDLKQAAAGKMPMKIPITMEHLRVMSLIIKFTSKKQVALVLCLLRSAPTIEELEIKGIYCWDSLPGEYRVGKEFWEAQKHVDMFYRLRRVKMTGIQGIITELDFIHFVLAKAQTLETMMVTFSQFFGRFKSKERFMSKLLGFPRASNQAQILLYEAEAEELEGELVELG